MNQQDIQKLSRQEKENLYKAKMTKLQKLWKNPLNDDFSTLKEWSDEELDKGLETIVGQVQFESGIKWFKIIVAGIVILVILYLFN